MNDNDYVDSDDKIVFKYIKLRITEAEYEQWKKYADKNNKTLDDYIKCSVESQALKQDILKYLNRQADKKPWWEKKTYIL